MNKGSPVHLAITFNALPRLYLTGRALSPTGRGRRKGRGQVKVLHSCFQVREPVSKCASSVVPFCLRILLLVVCISLAYSPCYPSSSNQSDQYVVEDMVDVSQLNSSIIVQLAYSTPNNFLNSDVYGAVSYTHLTLPTINGECRSRWSPYH